MRNVNLCITEKPDCKIVRLAIIDDISGRLAFVTLTEEQRELLEYIMEEFDLDEYVSIDFNPTTTEI